MKILFIALAIICSLNSQGQLIKRIKDRVEGKAKSEAGQAKNDAQYKARQAARQELEDFKSELDSTDIDYALLLSDNSGLFGGRGRNDRSLQGPSASCTY